jgi:hypothetical protein
VAACPYRPTHAESPQKPDDSRAEIVTILGAKAGITKRVHPHGWRHTFAVELEAAGTRVTTISKLLGHSSVAVTARYLDHLTNGQAVAAHTVAELPSLTAAEMPDEQRRPDCPPPAGRTNLRHSRCGADRGDLQPGRAAADPRRGPGCPGPAAARPGQGAGQGPCPERADLRSPATTVDPARCVSARSRLAQLSRPPPGEQVHRKDKR